MLFVMTFGEQVLRHLPKQPIFVWGGPELRPAYVWDTNDRTCRDFANMPLARLRRTIGASGKRRGRKRAV